LNCAMTTAEKFDKAIGVLSNADPQDFDLGTWSTCAAGLIAQGVPELGLKLGKAGRYSRVRHLQTGLTGFKAMAVALGITDKQSHYIFSGLNYIQCPILPEHVITHMRDVAFHHREVPIVNEPVLELEHDNE